MMGKKMEGLDLLSWYGLVNFANNEKFSHF